MPCFLDYLSVLIKSVGFYFKLNFAAKKLGYEIRK
jgi:hypothetical protein